MGQTEVVKLCGLPLSDIEAALKQFEGRGVKFEAEESFLDAKITMTDEGAGPQLFATVKSLVYNAFSEHVYSPFDMTLEELAKELLKRSGNVLSVAESITGGEVCSRLISVDGISENFSEGIVCYNVLSKLNRLGVRLSTLKTHGAVSKQTAREMVQGLVGGETTIGLSTTGNAGPTGSEGKPVGLVYIGVGRGNYIAVFEHKFTGERNEIRKKVANMALFYLIRYLQGNILML
mgnify:CR=1 FL=1